jgi:hypothetical protein
LENSTEILQESKARSRAEIFAALIRDERISHGAFRLWHCLRDYVNSKTGESFPGQREIQSCLHCSNDSLKPWTNELITAGWLKTRAAKSAANPKGFRFIYTLLDGTGEPFLLSGTHTVPKNRNATNRSQNQEHTVPKSRSTAFLKVGTKVTPLRGVVNKVNKTAALQGDSALEAQSPADPFTNVGDWKK